MRGEQDGVAAAARAGQPGDDVFDRAGGEEALGDPSGALDLRRKPQPGQFRADIIAHPGVLRAAGRVRLPGDPVFVDHGALGGKIRRRGRFRSRRRRAVQQRAQSGDEQKEEEDPVAR